LNQANFGSLAIEKWIFARDFVVVPGAFQVYVLRQSGTLKMLIVKVVDDIIVCGPPDEIQAFYKDLSRTYKLNPLRTGSRVRFSGMDVVTDNDGSTTIDVANYLAACSDIPLSARRRKQQERMHSGRANSLPDLARKIELPGCNWNAASELCCVPRKAASCLSPRFRFMRGKCLLRRQDQFSLTSYVDDNSCWLVSSLPSLFFTMSSHRDICI
jgi:hypothetical protein